MAGLWQSFLNAPDYTSYSPFFPNPFICARDMALTLRKELYDRYPWEGPGVWFGQTWNWLMRCHLADPAVIVLPLIIAVALTLLRIFLNWAIFKRIPVWFQLTPDASEKFPESIWKCLYYTCTWHVALYILVSGENNLLFQLDYHWNTWDPTIKVEPMAYWLYMTQIGFYVHCVYATVYIETIRRDFLVLLMHHLLTICLLAFSYLVRFHYIGLMLLFVLDIGDVFLELSKTVFYFKDMANKKNPVAEMAANVCFGIFTLQHIFLRIYWYPTKLIYSAQHVSVIIYPKGPFYLLFVPMLWLLYAMQVYWFRFILRLLWKILILGEELEDNREYEEDGGKNGQVSKKKD